MAPVLGQQGRLVDLGYYLNEGYQCHVGQAPLLLLAVPRQAPREEECVPDVFVGTAEELIDYRMDYTCDAVDKDHDLVLQNLSSVCEVPDVAEAEDGLHSPPGYHGIQRGAVSALEVLPDDLCTGLAEAQRQKRANLDDGLFQDHRLHRLRRLLGVPSHRSQHHHPPPDGVPVAHDLSGQAARGVAAVQGLPGPLLRSGNLLPVMLLIPNRHGLQGIVPNLFQL
mmetsp:Transcript_23805/g.54386  ORF Transcript_23805/g.54386 Transcript_23805/m.54386 type:complete len:224 (+) Transcript_23805:706-1377(+)